MAALYSLEWWPSVALVWNPPELASQCAPADGSSWVGRASRGRGE